MSAIAAVILIGCGFGGVRCPRPGGASVADFIRHMVLGIGIEIFRLVDIVLQNGHGADKIAASLENVQHRLTVPVATQPGSHQIPTAHSPALTDPLVVGRPKITFEL